MSLALQNRAILQGGKKGEKVQRKGGGRGVASKGGEKEQGRVKTGKNKYHPNRKWFATLIFRKLDLPLHV